MESLVEDGLQSASPEECFEYGQALGAAANMAVDTAARLRVLSVRLMGTAP